MKFFNNGKGKGPKHDAEDHQPGPSSFDVPGFIVAFNAGGNPPFLDHWHDNGPDIDGYPDAPEVEDWEEPELM